MSGAGLFVNAILVGVLIIDEAGYAASRLSALPVHRLHSNSAFREAITTRLDLDEHGELVSVELDHLLAPPWPRRRRRVSPAALLRADAEVVPFRSRTRELEELVRWCDSSEDLDFRLLVGPGGLGKTRLGRELVHSCVQAEWTAGFLIPDQPDDSVDLAALIDTAGPLLLIIDYGDTRTGQIARLLTQLRLAPEIARIRVVLLARSAGSWWGRLCRRNTDILTATDVKHLATLDDSLQSRREAFDAAVDAFTEALQRMQADIDWQAIADTVGTPDDLDSDRYRTPLTLQMTALLALLESARGGQAAEPSEVDRARPLELQILDHEQGYWEDSAAEHGVQLHPTTLSTAVAAAVLLGASNSEQAVETLKRLPDLEDQPADRRKAVDEWLHDLYPGVPGQRWGPLQPDRLAEHLVASHIAENPGLLSALVAGATDGQLVQALTLLWRALPNHSYIARHVRGLLEGDRTRLEPIAVAVTTAAKSRSLGGTQEFGKIYSDVSIEERRTILDQWMGSDGVIL